MKHQPANTTRAVAPNVQKGFLNQIEARAADNFAAALKKATVWKVQQGQQTLWEFYPETGICYPVGKLQESHFGVFQRDVLHTNWLITKKQVGKFDNKNGVNNIKDAYFYDARSRLVWRWFYELGRVDSVKARKLLAKKQSEELDLRDWHFPKKNENELPRSFLLRYFGKEGDFYFCRGGGNVIFRRGEYYGEGSGAGFVVAYNNAPKESPKAFWDTVRNNGYKRCRPQANLLLDIPDFDAHANNQWRGLSPGQIFTELQRHGYLLQGVDPDRRLDPKALLEATLIDLDYTPCRLPKLQGKQINDPNLGLWELFDEEPELLELNGLRGRDPARDVRSQWVAIDFGTSSTVVAVATPSGGKDLLRVGLQDFYADVKAKQYENPTALEFVDLGAFTTVWNAEVYRPSLDWAWVRAANEALTNYQDHANDPVVVNSVVRYLKRWAREAERVRALVVDQKHGRELLLQPLQQRNPTVGQSMRAEPDAPLDVVELYAWYLGMTINWRGRGIFYRYAMTFPVKYEREVKARILASFRRGLQRSFLEKFVRGNTHFAEFEVVEVSSEPMAYAAAILPNQEPDPRPKGLANAVFDFGGGTTDFDFGYWRAPTPAESEQHGEPEAILERLRDGGDPTLGGENLLAMIAYQAFQDNLDMVRSKKLIFTRPDSEKPFPGSEAFIDQQSGIAHANTALLLHRLRPLLEQPDKVFENKITLDLLDHHGQKVEGGVELSLNSETLQNKIGEHIARGVDGFFMDMRAAFAGEDVESITILLAGNASQGKWVREAFATDSPAWQERVDRYFGAQALIFVVLHAPAADDLHPEQPTCKTAVALGALDLVRGSAIVQIDRQEAAASGATRFPYYAGGLRKRCLQPSLLPGTAFGTWVELGPVREGVFQLAWSESPHARHATMQLGDNALQLRDIKFPNATTGDRCWARVVDTHVLELVCHTGLKPPAPSPTELCQRADLALGG